MIRILAFLVLLTAIVAISGCGGDKSADTVVPAGMKVTNLTSDQLAAGKLIAEKRQAQRRASQ